MQLVRREPMLQLSFLLGKTLNQPSLQWKMSMTIQTGAAAATYGLMLINKEFYE